MAKRCSTKMDPKAFEFDTENGGPGPAAYGVKTTVGWRNRMPNISREPVYTVKHPLDLTFESESPGPAYQVERLTRNGKHNAPKFSIGMKLPPVDDISSPGPAAYMVKNAAPRAKPRILLPLKRLDSKAEDPGPNKYKLPSTLSGKAASLAKKIEVIEDDADSPGPAVYRPVPTNKYRKKPPEFTLGKQFEDPLVADENKSLAPSPQAYKPTLNYKYKNMPKFSFGIRRPDKFAPLIVCGDDVKK